MRCIFRKETDPYFNLAAEEYIFKNSEEDIFMLWRNNPAVILGKHQNAFAEVNHSFVTDRNIAVIRRISGGGTVYHDLGNINFTFMAHGEPEHLVDFHKFTLPLLEALQKMQLQVAIGNRNSLYINGLKISGNAEHVYRNRVLHHGTLLYNSDLEALENAIKPSQIQFIDKAVRSVRSRVVNISDFLHDAPPVEDFAMKIFKKILSLIPGSYIQNFTLGEIAEIEKLSNNKYQLWEWNYGYSPPFSFPSLFIINELELPVEVHVKEGKVESITSKDHNAGSAEIEILSNLLYHMPLRHDSVIERLKLYHQNKYTQHLMHALFPADGPAEHLQNMNV